MVAPDLTRRAARACADVIGDDEALIARSASWRLLDYKT